MKDLRKAYEDGWTLMNRNLSVCVDMTRDIGKLCIALRIFKADHIEILCVCVCVSVPFTFANAVLGLVEKLFFLAHICIFIQRLLIASMRDSYITPKILKNQWMILSTPDFFVSIIIVNSSE